MAGLVSSRVLSRFLPVAEGDVSVYESIRRDQARQPDVESEGRSAYHPTFHDEDDEDGNPDEAFLDDAAGMQRTAHDVPSPDVPASSIRFPVDVRAQPRRHTSRDKRRIDDNNDDVPESLLLDDRDKPRHSRPSSKTPLPPADSRLSRAEAQWRAMQEQHSLHAARDIREARSASRRIPVGSAAAASGRARADPKADAMWLYTNAHNLDAFLKEVYRYYVEHGVWSILLSRVISLLTELFVFSFAMFLSTCIDYSKIPSSKSTGEVLIPKCMAKASWLKNAALFVFIVYWLSRLANYIADTRRLFRMHDFYLYVLGINDVDVQTVSWVRVVDGLIKVQDANIATANPRPSARKYLHYREPQQRLSAESIANRLMRQDNYYVALYNKDILDFTLPLPLVGTRQFYSKSLEWCIDFCLTNFIFDEQGSIRPFCLEVRNRRALVQALQMRLRFAAIVSIVIAPFNILRFCIIYFFKYYTEFTRNPARASARTFTPYAEWKIREFNELEHLFERRLRQAYPFAKDYLAQFPKDKTDQLCRFIAFVSGAIAAVLTLATLFDPELFLSFQVTPGRTAVFWLTVMVGIFGVAHGSVPDENEVHDPVLHLKEVFVFTHYMPSHWKDRLHSNEVRAEFSALYQMKVVIFVEEVLSLIVAPWILWRNSGKSVERIVDFFREQTVHVEGIGHQCNFAVFGFKKDLNAEDPTHMLLQQNNEPDGLRDDYFGLKDDKMASSVVNFMSYYSHYTRQPAVRRTHGWQPPPVWPPVMHQSPAMTEGDRGQQQKTTNIVDVNSRRHQLVRPASGSTVASPPQRATASMSVLRHHSPRQTSRRKGAPTSSQQIPQEVEEESGLSMMAQDSDLRDFADAPGLMPIESDTDAEEEEEEGDHAAGGGAGVLGMLYQFSKAQTERGANAVL